MDRKDLKIQALLERIRDLTTNYENQVADLRVELTVVNSELTELKGAEEEANPDTEDAD